MPKSLLLFIFSGLAAVPLLIAFLLANLHPDNRTNILIFAVLHALCTALFILSWRLFRKERTLRARAHAALFAFGSTGTIIGILYRSIDFEAFVICLLICMAVTGSVIQFGCASAMSWIRKRYFPAKLIRDRLFISYRQSDASQVTGRLADFLGDSFPEQIFSDISGIEPGLNFEVVIQETLQRSALVVVVIGPNWAAEFRRRQASGGNDYVLFEVRTALQYNVPLIIPLLVDDAVMPSPAELPEDIREICKLKAISINYRTFRKDIQPIVEICYDKLQVPRPSWWERFNARFIMDTRAPESGRSGSATLVLWFSGLIFIWSLIALSSKTLEELNDAWARILAGDAICLLGLFASGWRSRTRRTRARVALILVVTSALIPLISLYFLNGEIR